MVLDARKDPRSAATRGMRLGRQCCGVKVQIGLLGRREAVTTRPLDIAPCRRHGPVRGRLHYVLEETCLALLRNPEYCVYGYATSATADGPENAEDLFNEYSMDERGVRPDATLVNVLRP